MAEVREFDVDAVSRGGRLPDALTYRVKGIWKTLQGEGFWAGRPAVFCRLVACNMWSGREEDRERDAERSGADCPRWCDTDFTAEGSEAYTADALARQMRDVGGDIDLCVLTGGEPFLQADAGLIRSLHEHNFQVAVETNGTLPIAEVFADERAGGVTPPDWIVCSPKLPSEQIVIEYCDELKLVVPDYQPTAYGELAGRVKVQRIDGEAVRPLWLQPEDGPRFEEAKELAVALALENPAWRVSVQIHKVLGVR